MIRLGSPLWLLLLLPVIARVVLFLRDRKSPEGAFSFSSLSLVANRRTFRTAFAGLPFLLETAALALLVLALARPQRVIRMAADDRFGVDMVIAIDSSGSMNAEDFKPRNRFAVAKELIGDFIQRRQDDRIGIVTFGQRAVTRVPITFDRQIAEALLDRAETGENGDGTAIGTAIATAVNRLRNSKASSKVILLVTDGVSNAGSISPPAAAQLAAEFGIKVYVIGIGSEGNVPVPVKRQNPMTGEVETVYAMVRGEIDERAMKEVTRATGGEFFRATDPRAMSEVLQRIDQLEKSRLTAPKSEKIDELYPWPLAAALVLLVMALLTGETYWMKVPA